MIVDGGLTRRFNKSLFQNLIRPVESGYVEPEEIGRRRVS
jgi:hypothetical protein